MWRKNLLAASKAAFPAAKEECAAQLDLARKNHAAKCANIVRTLPIWSPGSPSKFCVSQRKELATPVTNQFIVEYRVMRQEHGGCSATAGAMASRTRRRGRPGVSWLGVSGVLWVARM